MQDMTNTDAHTQKKNSAHLCEIFANRLRGGAQVMAEGTGIAGLAGSLAEKLARDVRCVYKQQSKVSACSGNQSLLIVRLEPWSCAGLSVGEALDTGGGKQKSRGFV